MVSFFYTQFSSGVSCLVIEITILSIVTRALRPQKLQTLSIMILYFLLLRMYNQYGTPKYHSTIHPIPIGDGSSSVRSSIRYNDSSSIRYNDSSYNSDCRRWVCVVKQFSNCMHKQIILQKYVLLFTS